MQQGLRSETEVPTNKDLGFLEVILLAGMVLGIILNFHIQTKEKKVSPQMLGPIS